MAAPNKSAYTKIAVSFKEIEAMYDVAPGRRVTGTPSNPVEALDNGYHVGSLLSSYQLDKYVDVEGKSLGPVTSELPGVYTGVRITGYAPLPRTFSRERAKPVENKYVYVWSATDTNGSGLKLCYELAFENGQFRQVNLESPANKDKDQRSPGNTARKSLLLDIVNLDSGQQLVYFFMLAPFQAPWKMLQEMAATVPERASILFDPFCTDAYQSTNPGSPVTLQQLPKKQWSPEKVSWLVYLIDPILEGIRRSDAAQKAQDAWREEQERLSRDSEYVLAKRIDLFACSNKDIYQHVQGKLPYYLSRKEKRSFLLRHLAEMQSADLIRWIGERQQPDTIGVSRGKPGVAFFYSDGQRRYGNPDQKPIGKKQWSSPYSQMVEEYRIHGSDDLWLKVGLIVGAVQEPLTGSNCGREWLTNILEKSMGDNRPIEDGGSGFLFEAGRKGHASAMEVVGGTLKHFGPIWVKKYRKDATSTLSKWIKTVHGIQLEEFRPRRVRRIVKSQARRSLKKARKSGLRSLRIEPGSVSGLKATQKSMHTIAMAIEIINLASAVEGAASSRDKWDYLNATGAVLDATAALGEINSKIGSTKIAYAGGTKVIRVMPVVAVASGAIDTVLAARDTYKASNYGNQIGHALRTVGSLMTVGGAVTAESGWGAIVMIVGLGLQAIGSWVVANFSDAGLFVQYCKWGTPTNTTTFLNYFSDKNNFGYRGDLDKLPDNLPEQSRILDWLVFPYEPALEMEDAESVIISTSLHLKMGVPEGVLFPDARWKIDIKVSRTDKGAVLEDFHYPPVEYLDDIYITNNGEIVVKAFAKEDDKDAKVEDRPEGDIEASGTVQLDVFGNGAKLITKKVELSYSF